VDPRSLRSRAAAEAALRSGRVDLVVVDDSELILREPPEDDSQLGLLATAVSQRLGLQAGLERAGVSGQDADEALSAPPLPLRTLEPQDDDSDSEEGVVFIGLLVLYIALLFTAGWIVNGVVEEKANRVVEVLLAVIRPAELMAGKVIGIGVIALGQLIVVAVPTVIAMQSVGADVVPSGSVVTVVWIVVWFVLGYAFYGCAFAAAGALAGRQEDAQAVSAPLTTLVIASYFVGLTATSNPDSTLAVVFSFVPGLAPMAMPARIALGDTPAWQVAVSIALTLIATAVLVRVAGRVYAGAILRAGRRTRLREAWGAATS
jgi:ABC-2 type transport system permease protein